MHHIRILESKFPGLNSKANDTAVCVYPNHINLLFLLKFAKNFINQGITGNSKDLYLVMLAYMCFDPNL